MHLAELQRILRAADPAAVLVSPRILERVIQETCHLPGLVWLVPHGKSYVVDRSVLFRYVEQDELHLEPDHLLPSTVILLARPATEDLEDESGALLLRYWRRLFHANVHLVLENRIAQGLLTPEELRHRIERMGVTEFEEIRRVLVQEQRLHSRASEQQIYVEFIAVYLELKYFAANLLPVFFPGILDPGLVDEQTARDLDGDALYRRTRLLGAPDPVVRSDTGLFEAHEYYWRLMRQAERAAETGNVVKATILHTRAARVAPPALAGTTRAAAEEDLQALTQRLQTALLMSDREAEELFQALRKLAEKADQGRRPSEAAFLYDLQKACLDHEQEIYVLDLIQWALSAGRKPIKRPLPSQRLVRITRHLRAAVQRLVMARLTDGDRQHLTNLLQNTLHQTEERLRARFRPALVAALEDVGLRPSNPPEQTAFSKMVEEMIDRIKDFGYLTFSDLRDSISRNQLKMPDLTDPQEFIRGDPLIRLDRRLATLLDGVYRPGEMYMRWLERLTALNFGTGIGRALTNYVTLPFGGAFLLVEGSKLVCELVHAPKMPRTFWLGSFFTLAVFFLALVHSGAFRQRVKDVGLGIYRPLRSALFDLPIWLAHIRWVRLVFASWPMLLLWWFILKPGLATLLLWLFFPHLLGPPPRLVLTFVVANFVLNSRLGQAVSETITQGVFNVYNLVSANLFVGLLQLIIRIFKKITDSVEYVLVSVEEWLRFRAGDSKFGMVVRALAGLLWFPIGYVMRFYMIVLIEPGINPLKLPLSSIAAKFIYPVLLVGAGTDADPLRPLIEPLEPWLGTYLANFIVWFTVWLSPDLFAFLAWETRENWSLYRAHRPSDIGPVTIGHHGETLRGLLQPGFHSGTLPKLYSKLRRAERDAARTGNWRLVRSLRQGIEDIRECITGFVTRELVVLLHQSTSWQARPLSVGTVHLASNRVRVELCHASHPKTPLWLEFESRSRWLLAGIAIPGWLPHLPPEQMWAFIASLTCLYKLAGVDLVHEQLRANLPPAGRKYDISRLGPVIWLDRQGGHSLTYDLRDANEHVLPVTEEGERSPDWPVLEARRLLFARFPLTWEHWVKNWEQDLAGEGQTRLLGSEFGLALIGQSTQSGTNGVEPGLNGRGHGVPMPVKEDL